MQDFRQRVQVTWQQRQVMFILCVKIGIIYTTLLLYKYEDMYAYEF